MTPPKTRSSEKFLRKTQEKKKFLRNPVRNAFLGPKNKFLKTGITNLAEGKAKELPASAPEIPANPPYWTEGCKHHHL